MRLTITAIALLISAPAFAGDYVDANGCTHIDMGGYYNLGFEAGCGRRGSDGGLLAVTPVDEAIGDRFDRADE